MQRTKHVLVVGQGALTFAKDHGFPEVDLLIDVTRKAGYPVEGRPAPRLAHPREGGRCSIPGSSSPRNDPVTHGTIHLFGARHARRPRLRHDDLGPRLQGPVRVLGDSPIIGAGLHLDNTVGSCGSVGLGEVNLVNCASYLLIENLRNGMEPNDALVALFKRIKEVTCATPGSANANGNPPGVNFYLVTKDGRVAAANMGGPIDKTVTMHYGDRIRTFESETLLA